MHACKHDPVRQNCCFLPKLQCIWPELTWLSMPPFFLLSFLWQACAKCTEDRHMDCLSRMCTASVRSIGDTNSPNITNYSRRCSKLRQEDIEKETEWKKWGESKHSDSLLVEITTAEVMAVRNVSDANFWAAAAPFFNCRDVTPVICLVRDFMAQVAALNPGDSQKDCLSWKIKIMAAIMANIWSRRMWCNQRISC